MADRWDERHRGAMDRAGDEVRSWFGDDEATRRRYLDEQRERERERDRDWHDGGHRGSLERGYERSRDTLRDLTDRDRDGRRGFSEWADDDRPSHRLSERTAWGSSPAPFRSDEGFNRGRGYAGSYGPSYAGRGPRGYQRGDERIREDVCDRLTDDHRVDASDIEIQIRKGEVTLSGSVRSREEKRYAEDIVERVSGVRDVSNHLKVKPADEILGTARSGASPLGLTDTPPPRT